MKIKGVNYIIPDNNPRNEQNREVYNSHSKTGDIIETCGVDYPSWDHADAALSTLLGFRRTLTATIDRYVVEVFNGKESK